MYCNVCLEVANRNYPAWKMLFHIRFPLGRPSNSMDTPPMESIDSLLKTLAYFSLHPDIGLQTPWPPTWITNEHINRVLGNLVSHFGIRQNVPLINTQLKVNRSSHPCVISSGINAQRREERGGDRCAPLLRTGFPRPNPNATIIT